MALFRRLSGRDAEALVAGDPSAYTDLNVFVDALRAECAAVPSTDRAARHVMSAVQAFSHVVTPAAVGASVPAPSHHVAGPPLLHRLRSRTAAVTAGVVLAFGGTGVAWAADGAAPNDALYGLDRALERMGIGSGGAGERISEVGDLVAAGEIARGLEHASDVVGENAAAALLEAASRVLSQGADQSADVRERVSLLLGYLAGNVGAIDGDVVSDMARGIGRPAHAGPPGDAQEFPFGPPDGPGPPNDVPRGNGPPGSPGS